MDEQQEPELLVSVAEHVATVLFNRPEKRNAITGRGIANLSDTYAHLDADDDVRVIVLSGVGSAFSAGADLSRRGGAFQTPKDREHFRSSPKRPLAFQLRKPVIAAINGAAMGVGMTLALHADIRYIAEDAKWGVVQVRRGVVPDALAHWTLVRSVGTARAAEILLSGRTFLGSEAVAFGVASRCLPRADVLPTALDLALEMATSNSPVSMGMTKRMLWAAADADVDRVDELESVAHRILMGSPDALEGGRAAFEKRSPQWSASLNDGWPGDGPFSEAPAPAWP